VGEEGKWCGDQAGRGGSSRKGDFPTCESACHVRLSRMGSRGEVREEGGKQKKKRNRKFHFSTGRKAVRNGK